MIIYKDLKACGYNLNQFKLRRKARKAKHIKMLEILEKIVVCDNWLDFQTLLFRFRMVEVDPLPSKLKGDIIPMERNNQLFDIMNNADSARIEVN